MLKTNQIMPKSVFKKNYCPEIQEKATTSYDET